MDVGLIFFFVSILVVGVVVFAIISHTKGGTLNVEKYRSEWMKIERSLIRDNESSYHLSILNADKLLDRALKECGYKGNTMGERMKSAQKTWSNTDVVWTAHKLRNQVAHETGVQIQYDSARRALSAFKQGLKDLEAI
ncbi:MAG: hypothetical protein ACSLEY_04285 [Candidatus Saccharimonadales bacterium]